MRHRGLAAWVLGLAAAAAAAAEPTLPQEDCGGLYWDLTAAFESGDAVYARVLVTNEGPGQQSAAALGHWIDSQGRATPFQNGRRRGRWELDAGGRRVRIGSTILDRSGPLLRFEYDNDKRGLKLHLAFDAEEPRPLEVWGGAYAVTVEALARPARGSAWRRGMPAPEPLEGWASLVRTRHTACDRDLAARRLDLHIGGSDGAFLLLHHTAPDGVSRSWLGWRETGETGRTATDLRLELSTGPTPDPGYPLPTSLRWSGPLLSGEAVLKDPHLSIDPVTALPRLVRMLYSFRVHPRRIWSEAAAELRLKRSDGAAAPLIHGRGIASSTFLRPLDALPASRNDTPTPDAGG